MRSLLRAVAMGAAAAAVGVCLVAGPAAAAGTAVNVVKTSSLAITVVGGTASTTVARWNQVRLSADWSTDAVTVVPGDHFTITLPTQFTVPVNSFDLMDGSTAIGTCAVTPSGAQPGVLTCTFGDYVSLHPHVSGDVYVQMQASQTTTASSVAAQVNGVSVSVPLPGAGGIVVGTASPVPTTLTKKGVWANSDHTGITWWVYAPVTTAGTVVVNDTWGTGQTLPEVTVAVIADTQDAWADFTLNGTATWLSSSQYTLTKTAAAFTLTVPEAAAGTLYLVRTSVSLGSSTPADGTAFTNSVSVGAQQASATLTERSSGGGGGTPTATPSATVTPTPTATPTVTATTVPITMPITSAPSASASSGWSGQVLASTGPQGSGQLLALAVLLVGVGGVLVALRTRRRV